MQIVDPITDFRTLADRYLRVAVPEYADSLMAHLDGVSYSADVLGDTVSVAPLIGESFDRGVILIYKLGLERNKYTKQWVRTKEVQISFTAEELDSYSC